MPGIIDRITNDQLDVSKINFTREITLEDTTFHIPNKINSLIGRELLFPLLKQERFKSFDRSLLFQIRVLGYLVTGTIKNSSFSHFDGLIFEQDNSDTVRNFSNVVFVHGDKFISYKKSTSQRTSQFYS